MTGPELHAAPGAGAVLKEQFRAVGLAVRREAAVAAVLAGALSLLVLVEALGAQKPLSPTPEDLFAFAVLVGSAGFLFPLTVWKGEARFGGSQLWCLPVSHSRHALLKVAAGWMWLLLFVAALLLLLLLLPSLLSGGMPGEGEAVLLLDEAAASRVRYVPWRIPLWQWLAPFWGATVVYLLGSALLLATPYPWRWIAGSSLFLLAGAVIGQQAGIEWLGGIFEILVERVLLSGYGLETVFTGGIESLETVHLLPSGDERVALRRLPTLGRWVTASFLWAAIGVAAVVAAASRDRER